MKGRRIVVVSGDTMPHRLTLGSNGFRWNPSEKVWWRQAGRCTAETFSMLRSLSGVQVNEDVDLKDDEVGGRGRRGRSVFKNGGKVLIDAVTVSGDHAHLLRSDLRDHRFRRDWGPRGWSTCSYWREAEGFETSTAEYFRSFGGVVVRFGRRFVPKVSPLVVTG